MGLLYCSNWLYCYLTCGLCRSKKRMDDKTVLITGCTSGIGKATAFDLARRGARVVMACRNLEKGQAVRDSIVDVTGNQNISVRLLDVSLMSSVRRFAEDIMRTEPRLDVLILNAGIVDSYKKKTVEGLNLIWATNHLGHFLLTLLLTDLLKKTPRSRVVIVSSVAHFFGELDLRPKTDLVGKSSLNLYCDTKLANVAFTIELARRLKDFGVAVNSLHPGAIHTPIWVKNPLWVHITLKLLSPFFKTEQQGAQTIIHLAVSENVEGVTGKYFSDCKESSPSKKCLDINKTNLFWECCEKSVQDLH